MSPKENRYFFTHISPAEGQTVDDKKDRHFSCPFVKDANVMRAVCGFKPMGRKNLALQLCQNLGAVIQYRNSVFELRRERAVGRDDRPAIRE